MTVALFVPCYIDQFYPHVAIAALTVLERLGVRVDVPEGAACCGQPSANAGFEREGHSTLERYVDVYAEYERVIVLSGSCAVHLRLHAGEVTAHGSRADAAGAQVAERTTEFCTFLHDEVGVDWIAGLGASYHGRVALHIGCHALRGLGLAKPSELQIRPFDKVRALQTQWQAHAKALPLPRHEENKLWTAFKAATVICSPSTWRQLSLAPWYGPRSAACALA